MKKYAYLFFAICSLMSSKLICEEEVEKEKFYYDNVMPNRYARVTSKENKFVCFFVAKSATNTIKNILKMNNVFKDAVVDIRTEDYFKEDYTDYVKFTFVRNPWDRVVSCYFNKVVRKAYSPFEECYGKDFEYFVRFIDRQNLLEGNTHISLQIGQIPMEEIDFIGRLENFSEDFSYALSLVGIEYKCLLHKNKTNHLHYSKYYTDETREIIARKYQPDIEAFGYQFEIVD